MPLSRRLGAAVAAAALIIVGLVAPGADAAGTRTISGTVTWPSDLGTPWKNWVSVGIQSTTGGGTVATGSVNPTTGAYAVSGLAPGVYQVTFSISGYEDDNGVLQFSNVMSEVYDNVKGTYTGYTPVDVTAANKSGINGALEYGTTIKGKVTVPTGTGSNWYRGVYVTASAPNRNSAYGYVNPNGTYVIRGILPGDYTIGARVSAYWLDGATTSTPAPLLIPEYWKEKRGYSDATPVTAPAAGATGIDFTLAKSLSMSGTVSIPSGEDTKQLAAVSVRVTDGKQVDAYGTVNSTTGKWSVTGIPAGTYTVQFVGNPSYWNAATSTYTSSDIIGEYYNNSTTASGATKVTLTTANKTGVNATLRVGDSISGTVTLPAGSPTEWLNAIGVSAITSTGARIPGTVNRTTGAYRISQLLPGGYTVNFTVGAYSIGGAPTVSPALAAEYYNNSYTQAGATPLRVVAGTPRTNINATLAPAISVTVAPSIQWTSAERTAVKVNNGTWSPTPTSFTYEWLRGSTVISGATQQTYTLTPADHGTAIYARVTGKAAGYGDTVKLAGASIPALEFSTAPPPTFTGTLRSGYTVRAWTGAWSPTPSAFKYQWLREGVKIAGATASTYKLTSTDRGKKITVTVTASRTGYTPTARTSEAKTVLRAFTTAPTPSILGTAKADYTLTMRRGTWSPTPTYSYQWYRSGFKVPGATTSTYKLTSRDKGKKITVRVTAKRVGYATTIRTSAAKTIAG